MYRDQTSTSFESCDLESMELNSQGNSSTFRVSPTIFTVKWPKVPSLFLETVWCKLSLQSYSYTILSVGGQFWSDKKGKGIKNLVSIFRACAFLICNWPFAHCEEPSRVECQKRVSFPPFSLCWLFPYSSRCQTHLKMSPCATPTHSRLDHLDQIVS